MLKPFAAVCLAATFATTAAMAEPKTSVTVAAPWEIASYDPTVAGFVIQALQVMENLVDADETGALRPALATKWDMSDDGLTWTFTLRDGVTFHDGSAFNAQAAASALNRAWKQPGVLQKAPITAIKADAGKIIITVSESFTALPSLMAHATTIIPAPSAFDAEGTPSALIGTGPFSVSAFTPPQSISLARNEAYWGENATLETATYLAAGRAETRALLAESGDADVVFTLDPSGFSHLQHVDSIETAAVAIPRVVVLKVNAGHAFFDDARARKALSLAIPREGIAKAITRFPDSAATQLFPPVLHDWHSQDLAPLKTVLEQAKALLADLGWAMGEDGILMRDGERFSIQLRTFPDRPELPLIAAALQDTWRELGIEVDVSVSNYSEIPAGHKDGSLHVALFARNYGLTPDPIGTILQDFGPNGGDWGAMGWTNDEAAKALQVIASTADPDLRQESIAKVAGILYQDLPVIPVAWYQHTVSINKDLGGVIIDPLQRSYGLSTMFWNE
ncbi:peptide/nickel transport system substrate-binding protein [Pacificibacter maritimus]|uniref:Peptide/nickel transport system substrate-binding protein n=1 Tax=Pacificibacter maritimus TaxID=762213 RepID=A0A3N4ULD6_9RHOB|nr:ABC transporter substrate-binding protein [Pacificibacter maritimus]RPE71253.1 peptide/nickel transport system substrate-binding protein [Pacificibacter maritimus]